MLTEDNEIYKMLRDDDTIINSIGESKSKVVVCAGYKEIIPKEILENKIIINTHPSSFYDTNTQIMRGYINRPVRYQSKKSGNSRLRAL